MELLQELLLTASISLVLAFFFSKVVFAVSAPHLHRPPMRSPLPPKATASSTADNAAGGSGFEHAAADVIAVVDRRIADETVEVWKEKVGDVPIEEDVKERERETEVSVEDDDEAIAREREGGFCSEEEREGKEREVCIEEEDWEGVERSDLEEAFGAAVAFVRSEAGAGALSRLSGDDQMRLYGLQKLAMEGPCYESQPMTLKLSARSRWHAWQKLGNMDQEVAMEEYITLLSNKVPGWMDGKTKVVDENLEATTSFDRGISQLKNPDSSLEDKALLMEIERKTDFS